MILINAVKRISPDFSILKEARREVLEDLIDVKNTKKVIEGIEKKQIRLEEISTNIPSPIAFNLIAQGITDILKIEDRVEFLRRMHKDVLAKIKVGKIVEN
jgi:ATP-dependent helicase Lhr and Lhr-like helicase